LPAPTSEMSLWLPGTTSVPLQCRQLHTVTTNSVATAEMAAMEADSNKKSA